MYQIQTASIIIKFQIMEFKQNKKNIIIEIGYKKH